MAVTTDIVRTWRGPRVVMRELLAHGRREDRAVAYVIAACLLIFVAQGPRLSRQAAGFDLAPGAETRDITELLSYELFAWLMIWPLLLYGIAAITHVLAKIVGGKGTFYSARLALFWALLASTPVLLLYGLMAGFVGPGLQTQVVGGIWVLSFGWMWLQCLREAES